MEITYDREVDALYICFKKTTVTFKASLRTASPSTTTTLTASHGIEIFSDAAQRLANPDTLGQVIFECDQPSRGDCL